MVQDRRGFATKLVAVWIFQVSFSLLILREAFVEGNLEFAVIPELKIGFTRFIASMVMHVVVSEEVNNGLKMMKYVSNHWWKFSNARLAYISGLLQLSAMLCVAIVNYFVITISDNVLDIAKDFTALLIIGEFDDALSTKTESYASVPDVAHDCLSEDYYESIFKIETTTSNDARGLGEVKQPKDEVWDMIVKRRTRTPGKLSQKRHPSIALRSKKPWGPSGRPVPQRIMFLVYRLLRWFYLTIWFYFFPFLVLCVMYIWPIRNMKLITAASEDAASYIS